jgi:hypothetical protein
MNQPADFEMEWKWVLNQKYLNLVFKNSRPGKDGVRLEMQAIAFYQITGLNTGKGTWFDSRGMMLPLITEATDKELIVHWGNHETEEGKTIYRMESMHEMQVIDYIKNQNGLIEFGNARYRRVDD